MPECEAQMAGGDKTHSYDVVREKMSPVVSTEPELAEALRRYVPYSAEEKKLVRKIDLFLMPILWIMYILNYVDRTNIVSLSPLRLPGVATHVHVAASTNPQPRAMPKSPAWR